jgi:hypothetical protein
MQIPYFRTVYRALGCVVEERIEHALGWGGRMAAVRMRKSLEI